MGVLILSHFIHKMCYFMFRDALSVDPARFKVNGNVCLNNEQYREQGHSRIIQLYFSVGKYQLNIDISYFINYHTGNCFVNNNLKSVSNSLQ